MIRWLVLGILSCLFLTGCSGDDSESTSKEHVLKSKTDAIDKAKALEGQLHEAAKRHEPPED